MEKLKKYTSHVKSRYQFFLSRTDFVGLSPPLPPRGHVRASFTSLPAVFFLSQVACGRNYSLPLFCYCLIQLNITVLNVAASNLFVL